MAMGKRIYGCPGHLQTFERIDAGKNKLSAILRFLFTCCNKKARDVRPSFSKCLQKLRAKRIEIGQGNFTSCKRCLKFSELTGAIQDLAIHGKVCIQSSYRHRQCFSWILGTGANICIVDKDLIFFPNQKNDSAILCFKRKGRPPTQNL